MKLTAREIEVLNTIEVFIKNHSYSPTYQELAEILNCSVSNVIQIVARLERKKKVSTEFGKSRTIKVV